MSTTVLALVVALVSVISTTLPQLNSYLTKQYSDVTVLPAGMFAHNLRYQVVNAGNRNAIILTGKLEVTYETSVKQVDLEILGNAFLLFPNSGYELKLFIPPSKITDFLSWGNEGIKSVAVVVAVQDFGADSVPTDRIVAMSVTDYRNFREETKTAFSKFPGPQG